MAIIIGVKYSMDYCDAIFIQCIIIILSLLLFSSIFHAIWAKLIFVTIPIIMATIIGVKHPMDYCDTIVIPCTTCFWTTFYHAIWT
jgi:hypothetical protein